MDFSLVGANIAKLWTNYWHIYILEGVVVTLQLTAFAVVLGALLGVIVALLKMSKSKIIRFFITVYIEIIRGTPILLQLYVFYFVLPELFPLLEFSEFTWCAIALCINSSAYVSEVFRSGIQSVDIGQTEAARSLGLSSSQTMVRIVLPQAVKNILPAMGNELVMMLKETSLASTFFVGEITTKQKEIGGATYAVLEMLIVAGIIYLVLTTIVGKMVAIYERRLRISD